VNETAPRWCNNCHNSTRTILASPWGWLCTGCTKGTRAIVDYLEYAGFKIVAPGGELVTPPTPPPVEPESPEGEETPDRATPTRRGRTS